MYVNISDYKLWATAIAGANLWYCILQLSTIWTETADNARSAARSFVLGGLSEKNYGLSDFWVLDKIYVLT